MSVIIRLQNLPWSANALDIRKYFHGLSIPEGGVHIVGGELGDAFIAFSTDEDARQAFNRNNGKIKEVQINLNLSSRTEMQRVIEAARNQSYAAFMQPQTTPLPTIVPAPLPAAIPEIKRDRKRSRSKSRERKDRSRERRRHRSRSRSRERRERRRRERSRSRGRSRSRERDRRTKRSEDRKEKTKIDVWSNQNSNESIQSTPQPSGIVGAFVSNDETSRAISLLGNASNSSTNFAQSKINNNNNGNNRLRDSWPPTNFQNLLQNQQNFQNFGFQNNNNARGGPSAGTAGGGGGGGNFQNNRGGGFRNNFQRNDNFDYHEEREIDHDTCIQLEPFYGGYGDVRRFFHGIFISNKGIKFINDEWGHRTGIVYIQCGHKQGKIEALAKNGDHLNGIKVEVVHLDEKEFDEAVDRYVPSMDEYSQDSDESKGGRSSKFKSRNITKYFNKNSSDVDLKDFSCVIVEDLPTYVKEQDILHMFSLHPLFSLILTTKPRVGHIAYVKFSNSEVAQKALEEKSHHIVGGKPVTVRPCTDEEFETINKQHEVNIDDDVDKISDIGTDCLSISPLPAKINERDIADFFSDIGIIPSKIHLMKNAGGQAFCEFDSTEEATRAAQKDDTTLGNIHVSVKAVDRSEMQTALGLSPQPNLGSPPIMGDPQQQALIQKNLMAHSGGMNLNRPPLMQQHRPFFNNRGNFDNGLRGGPRFGPRGGPRHRFGPPNMMAMNNGGGNSTSNNDDAPPGCTVFMDNVPYKAGTNEILDFFDGYNITNNVSRRYNPNNTPSAEAKVQFHSPEDAFRAVQELNGQKIWDRLIYLKQA